MAERYDFTYWPPQPIEQPPVVSAQTAPSEEICFRMAYIADDDRFRAVYATGEWADIEDFWAESEPPKPGQLRGEHAGPLTLHRVKSYRHLGDSTRVFRQTTLQLAHQHLADTLGDEYDWNRHFRASKISQFLQGCFDQQCTNRQERLLIHREALISFIEDTEEPNPVWGLAESGMFKLARVVMHWSDTMAQLDTPTPLRFRSTED